MLVAVELLCERWTLLVISRLIDGCKQFNEIHRGVPRISLGPNVLCKQFPSWLVLSALAPHPRLRNGREHRLAAACGNA